MCRYVSRYNKIVYSTGRLGDFLSDTFPFKSSPNIWCFFGYVDTHHFKVNTALATIG